MVKTLNLTENELKKLIVEVYFEITDKNFVSKAFKKSKDNNQQQLDEQAEMDSDGMVYLDPNQSMEANMSDLNRIQKELDSRSKTARTKYSDGVEALESGGDSWYNDEHIWLDILAAVLYIAGAITSAAGVGFILMGSAILVDLFNAYLYYQKEDYFMAGMTGSFIILPGINMAYIKALPGMKSLMKKLAGPVNKAFNRGVTPTIKSLTNTLGRKTTAAMSKVVKDNPVILKSMKKMKEWCYKMYNSFNTFIKWLKKKNDDWLYDWVIPDWIIAGLKSIRWAIKAVYETIKLALMVFIELSIYDGNLPAAIMDWAGYTSAADWFRKNPKYGLNFWNRQLERYGNYKGAMTTTPYDCRGSVWTWEEIVEKFKSEEKYSHRDSASERRIWEKWTEDNWRPDPILGDFAAGNWHAIQETYKDFPEIEKELKERYPDIMRDCYYYSRAFNSEDKEIKNKTISIDTYIDEKYDE